MSPNLSNKELIVLDGLKQIELLVIQGKLDQAKALFKTHQEKHSHRTGMIQAELMYYSALIHHSEMDYQPGLDEALSSFEYFRSTSDNRKIGRLQKLIARFYMDMGELEEAEQVYRDCLATWRRIKDKTGIFDCFNRLGQIKYIRGDYDAAAEFLVKAIESFKATVKDSVSAEITLIRYSGNLARIYIRSGRWGEAEELLRQCIDHNRRQNVNDSLIRNLLSLGYIGIRRRDQRLCEDCFAEVRSLLDSTQLKWEEGVLYEYMGEYYTEFNKFDLALQSFAKVIKLAGNQSSRNTLISQTLRRRAELYLAMARYDLAYKDALKGLEIARKVGETVEEAGCMKVLALITQRYRPDDDDTDYFTEAEICFTNVCEKNEVAKMHLAFSSIDLKSTDDSRINWCKEHLKSASILFKELNSDYYCAVTRLVEANLHLILLDFDQAFEAVNQAEEYFRVYGNNDDMGNIRGLRRSIENKMIEFAISEENEYNLVRSIFRTDEYADLRQADLESNLQFLAKRISADKAVLGLIDFSRGEFKPLAQLDFDLNNLTELQAIIKYTGMGANNLKPFYITSPYETSNGNSELFHSFKDAGSIIMIPMSLGSQKSAFIYLEKNARSAGGGFFTKADLNLSIAFSDILAFRAMEDEKCSLEKENIRLRTQLEDYCVFPNIITGNKDMLKMLEKVIQVKDSPISILIHGETGTGKDLLAKTIHYNSVRKDKRFISVNCAALPETLLESELFGYKRGAFTGADRDRAGLFEEADGGTFFLDEIGEMPLSIQAKLLRVLEDQEVVRLGDTKGRKVDVRLLSATNCDLKEMMSKGTFRQDLFYRLSAMSLKIPPLRDRRDDISLLISHFIKKYDPNVEMSSDVKQIFMNFSWPGNIRELDNEIKKMTLLSGEKHVITKDLLSRKFFKDEGKKKQVRLPEIDTFGQGFTLYDYITMFEKKYIKDALSKNRWVKKHAANFLGIPESTLRLKIKEYKIIKE